MKRFLWMIFLFGYGLMPMARVYADSFQVNYYSPKNILSFAEHLYREGDYLRAAGEYQRYLFYSPQKTESILYNIGLCYKLAGQTDRAIHFFQKITQEYPESSLLTFAHYEIGHIYFLMGQYRDSISYLKEAINKTQGKEDQWKLYYLIGINYLKQKRWNDANQLFSLLASETLDDYSKAASLRFKEYAKEGEHLSYKSPILAGFFSAVLPGTGKIYCKRYSEGLFSFLLSGTAGWLAYNSFHEDGIGSAKAWIYGITAGTFYIGNIYGSIVATQIYNRRLEDDLLAKIQIEIDLRCLKWPVCPFVSNGSSIRNRSSAESR